METGTGAGRGGTSKAQAPTAALARVVLLLLFLYIGVLSEILFKEMEGLCWHNSWKTTRGKPLGPTVGLKTSQTQFHWKPNPGKPNPGADRHFGGTWLFPEAL